MYGSFVWIETSQGEERGVWIETSPGVGEGSVDRYKPRCRREECG